MFGLVFSILTQPWTLIAMVVLAVLLAGFAYFRGIPALIKLVTDWRAIAGALALLALVGSANLDRKVDDLQEQVKTEQIETNAYVDAADVLTERAQQTRVRAGETRRIQEALTQATPGEEVDAVMDQIAAEQERSRSARDGAGA